MIRLAGEDSWEQDHAGMAGPLGVRSGLQRRAVGHNQAGKGKQLGAMRQAVRGN